MGTASSIGILNDDLSINSILCSFDGYLAGVGTLLFKYYNTPTIVKQLIELGDISSLNKLLWPHNTQHSFDHPAVDVTVIYHRDRGDELIKYYDKNLKSYLQDNFIKYHYLYVNKEWFCFYRNVNGYDCIKLRNYI